MPSKYWVKWRPKIIWERKKKRLLSQQYWENYCCATHKISMNKRNGKGQVCSLDESAAIQI